MATLLLALWMVTALALAALAEGTKIGATSFPEESFWDYVKTNLQTWWRDTSCNVRYSSLVLFVALELVSFSASASDNSLRASPHVASYQFLEPRLCSFLRLAVQSSSHGLLFSML